MTELFMVCLLLTFLLCLSPVETTGGNRRAQGRVMVEGQGVLAKYVSKMYIGTSLCTLQIVFVYIKSSSQERAVL